MRSAHERPSILKSSSGANVSRRIISTNGNAHKGASLSALPDSRTSSNTSTASKNTQLWSAVALQQHMLRSIQGMPKMPQPTASSANSSGKLTLAERMGLVAPPPPPPTEIEWSNAVDKSDHRKDCGRECSICQTSFVGSHGSAQVILSCSHVFHEQCIKQFEKFVRRSGATPSCPLCRAPKYHKRVHYQGKAQVQNHAAAKIQALVRGVQARKRYLTMRLRSNSKFRIDYAATQLKAISDSYTVRASLREKAVEKFLDDLDLTRQKAVADIFSLRDWEDVRNKILTRHDGLECPICMGTIDAHSEEPTGTAAPARPARGPHAYMLSCAHCFHAPCLESFEAFASAAAGTTTANGAAAGVLCAIPRCPVCRAGYAKRPLLDE